MLPDSMEILHLLAPSQNGSNSRARAGLMPGASSRSSSELVGPQVLGPLLLLSQAH